MNMLKTTTLIFLLLLLLPLAACGTPRAGLMTEAPVTERKTFALFAEFKTIETLTPTLRWQTIGQALRERNERKIHAQALLNVTYEMRIWKTETGYSGDLVYSRTGLKTPYHTLEKPLEHNSKYLWSVRGHFYVDGRARVSEWGMSGYLLQNEAVPNPACFRFKTAPAPN